MKVIHVFRKQVKYELRDVIVDVPLYFGNQQIHATVAEGYGGRSPDDVVLGW